MEANPTIYNTNFINNTNSAIKLIKDVNSKGFLLNLDLGTMIYNNESVKELEGNVNLINHVHISEPYLALIEPRQIHQDLMSMLKSENYDKFISIEMKQQDDLQDIKNTMEYLINIV